MGIFRGGKKNGKRKPMPKVLVCVTLCVHQRSSPFALLALAPARWGGVYTATSGVVFSMSISHFQGNPEDWTREEVQQWLGYMGFERYSEPFRPIVVRFGSGPDHWRHTESGVSSAHEQLQQEHRIFGWLADKYCCQKGTTQQPLLCGRDEQHWSSPPQSPNHLPAPVTSVRKC